MPSRPKVRPWAWPSNKVVAHYKYHSTHFPTYKKTFQRFLVVLSCCFVPLSCLASLSCRLVVLSFLVFLCRCLVSSCCLVILSSRLVSSLFHFVSPRLLGVLCWNLPSVVSSFRCLVVSCRLVLLPSGVSLSCCFVSLPRRFISSHLLSFCVVSLFCPPVVSLV
jgi:hypothetical protein